MDPVSISALTVVAAITHRSNSLDVRQWSSTDPGTTGAIVQAIGREVEQVVWRINEREARAEAIERIRDLRP